MKHLILLFFGIILLTSLTIAVAPTDYNHFWGGNSLNDLVTGTALSNVGNVGIDNNSFYFNNTNYLTANTSQVNNVSGAKNFTVSIWFNVSANVTDTVWWFASNTTDRFTATLSAGVLRVSHLGVDGNTYLQSISWTGVSNNTWHNLFLIYNGTMFGYLNNATSTGTTGSSNGGGTGMGIGASPSGSFAYQGRITQIKIWDRALTIAEKSSIYDEGYTGGCTIPSLSSTNYYSSDTVLCNGVYDFSTSNAIMLNISDNMVLDCNGATLLQQTPINWSAGIILKTNAANPDINNITIKNCIISGWAEGMYIADYTGVTMSEDIYIYNNTILQSGGLASIFIESHNRFFIHDNIFADNGLHFWENGRSIGSHGVYIGGGASRCPNYGEVYNNHIYNVTTGVKINAACWVSNIRIYENDIHDLHPGVGAGNYDDMGVHLAHTDNVSVYNNRFSNITFATSHMGIILNYNSSETDESVTKNANIYNNIFDNVTMPIYIRRGGVNNTFTLNNFSNVPSGYYEYYINGSASATFYETDSIRFSDTGWALPLLYLNFTGSKNFTINNWNFTIRNGQTQWNPYDDIKNSTTVLASNVDTYSKILSPSQPLTVGNFTASASNSCSYSGSGDWNITLSDNCTLNTPTNLENNTLIFTGAGNISINTTIQVNNWTRPVTGQIIFIMSNARLY